MDLAGVLSAMMFQSKWSQDLKSSRLAHRVTPETGNIEGSLWIDTVMTDYIPHTRYDQNQTIGARFQIVV
jgi:hypothetical protein